jgi:hypothetical protein
MLMVRVELLRLANPLIGGDCVLLHEQSRMSNLISVQIQFV